MSEVDPKELELDKKLEELRKAAAEREASRERRARLQDKENEVKLLELREQFADEGEEGVDFAICDLTKLDKGFVVVKRGSSALVRKYKSKFRGEQTPAEADTHALVKANLLYPEADAFNRITGDHDFVAIKLANVICEMHGVGLEMKGGKR